MSPLQYAAGNGHVGVFKQLFEKGANINHIDNVSIVLMCT